MTFENIEYSKSHKELSVLIKLVFGFAVSHRAPMFYYFLFSKSRKQVLTLKKIFKKSVLIFWFHVGSYICTHIFCIEDVKLQSFVWIYRHQTQISSSQEKGVDSTRLVFNIFQTRTFTTMGRVGLIETFFTTSSIKDERIIILKQKVYQCIGWCPCYLINSLD